MITPRTPPGVLELLPRKQLAFQRMLDVVRRGFERFGFAPIETPAFEKTEVLLTKSGGETEKQVYFVQSTGALENAKAPELALRFDLTVPLARYVAEHEHELNFPFRRYQIQRVYRGERNQKGRFREFYQCDIDVIGKDSLAIAHDAELPAVIYGIFSELAIGKFTILINNRKLLRGLLESLGFPADHTVPVLHEVDRLRKVGRDEVIARITAACGDAERAGKLVAALESPVESLSDGGNATLREGLDELRRVHAGTLALGVPADALKIDLSIVRGLDYYTGTVYETFLDDHPGIGSICSGGRYDNLAGHYSKSKLPGVGISIGATRLFWQLDELNALPAGSPTAVADVLVADAPGAAALATELRAAGFNVEHHVATDQLKKVLRYADRARVPVVALPDGANAAGGWKLKDMRVTDGRAPEQQVSREEAVAAITALLRSSPAPRA
jgi:histidyl-tRNA synthetase|nr:histidine--tRNA ligase [Kofleriaceae bacterium]